MRLFALVTVFLFQLSAFAFPVRNVQWGGMPELDACGGYGILLVKSVLAYKDGQGYMRTDKTVEAGTPVTFCDAEDGYTGVLIHKPGVDCGGGSAQVDERTDYTGPCDSGWIKDIFLELLAG